MKRICALCVFIFSFTLTYQSALAMTAAQARAYCGVDGYTCMKVQRGHTWKSLFPDAVALNIAKRVNRMNTRLRIGMMLVVPSDAHKLSVLDVAPFRQRITPPGEKVLLFDPAIHAWAAYGANGELVHWGPASGGKDYCPDTGSACRTVTGTFRIYSKGGAGCISNKFPIPYGGAPMPYCMFFHKGFAFHASTDVPGYAASHGCVRIFYEDAKWLNTEFVDTGSNGTRVIIRRNSAVSLGANTF